MRTVSVLLRQVNGWITVVNSQSCHAPSPQEFFLRNSAGRHALPEFSIRPGQLLLSSAILATLPFVVTSDQSWSSWRRCHEQQQPPVSCLASASETLSLARLKRQGLCNLDNLRHSSWVPEVCSVQATPQVSAPLTAQRWWLLRWTEKVPAECSGLIREEGFRYLGEILQ